jgi:hypothetical protein
MRDGERFNVSGFADLVDGQDEGDDALWRVMGHTSAAAMSVAMLLDDEDDISGDDPDALVSAFQNLDAPHREAVVVALARWAETRGPVYGEQADHPTIGELRQHIEVLGSLAEPLAAHDAAALRLLLGRLEAL